MKQLVRDMVPGIGVIRHTQSLPSAVTTEWKVKWSADMISRDLVQNFRDSAKGDMRQIRIKVTQPGGRVMIRGKEEFNVNRLYYIGSEKSAEAGDVGGFGEGFKAAAVALLRDYDTTPIVVSGSTGVALSVARDVVPGTDLRPLCYHFFDHDGDVSGTFLLLSGANRELSDAVKVGRDWYFDDKHPAISGACVFENEDIELYPSRRVDGLGFYGGHLRMKISGLPIVIHYKTAVAKLDTLVSSDRDRRMFDGKAAERYFLAISKALSLKGRSSLLAATKEKWRLGNGHPLLEAIANATRGDLQQGTMLAAIGQDADMFFVKGGVSYNYGRESVFAIERQEREWKEAGQTCLPNYFKQFGVKSAEAVHLEKVRQVREEQVRVERAEEERLRISTQQQIRDRFEAQLKVPLPKPARKKRDALVEVGRLLINAGLWHDCVRQLEIQIIGLRPLDVPSLSVVNGCVAVHIESSLLLKSFADATAWLVETIEAAFVPRWHTESTFRQEAMRKILRITLSHLADLTRLEQQWLNQDPSA